MFVYEELVTLFMQTYVGQKYDESRTQFEENETNVCDATGFVSLPVHLVNGLMS